MRLRQHPIIDVGSSSIVEGTKTGVKFYFEDRELVAMDGDTIASALIANGIDVFGVTEHGLARGFFCAIGKCSSCLVEVDGVPNVRSCITPVREGMRVRRQVGRGRAV